MLTVVILISFVIYIRTNGDVITEIVSICLPQLQIELSESLKLCLNLRL